VNLDKEELFKMDNEKYYSNDISGFKQWCRDHKMPMFSNDILAKKYHKKGNLYIEINKVKGFLSDIPFCGISPRQYNEEKHTFEYYGIENIINEKVFEKQIEDFCNKYNVKLP
jgi:hypothetical protein